MNVSTFTKKTKHEIIGFLILIASLLVYSRKPTLILVALVPIALAALLIMRTSILRRFARTPIRQVAFADLSGANRRIQANLLGKEPSRGSQIREEGNTRRQADRSLLRGF